MKFYYVSKPLYLVMDTSSNGLGAGLLQVRDSMNCGSDDVLDSTALYPTAFTSKSLSHVKWWYRNVDCEALGILHGREKFTHYCFAKEVNVITDQKL